MLSTLRPAVVPRRATREDLQVPIESRSPLRAPWLPDPHARLIRCYYLPLAAVVTAALIAQFFVTLNLTGPPTTTRLIRLASFFTIQSNVLVCVSTWALLIRPTRSDLLWRVLRLDAIAGISVTGLVYSIALAGLQHLHGWARLCDNVFHYVVPIAAFLGWLVIGPRGRVDRATVLWGLVWPLLWFAYTLLHGAKSGWYPYHFIDVKHIGYGEALRNALLVTVLLGAVMAGIWLVDRTAPSLTGRARRRPLGAR
jgi:hypothetical protein